MTHPDALDFSACINAHLRRTMRATNRYYDSMLKPAGIKSTQFTVLATLAHSAEVPLTRLSDMLGLDRTTLSRNLGPLASRGWVQIGREADERKRLISLTTLGRAKLDQAAPLWRQAQKHVLDHIGTARSERLAQDLNTVRQATEP